MGNVAKEGIRGKIQTTASINDFIADFICIEKRLIVEIDGGYHTTTEQKKSDEIRSEILNRMGFYVTRFTNEDVINNHEEVIARLKEILSKL